MQNEEESLGADDLQAQYRAKLKAVKRTDKWLLGEDSELEEENYEMADWELRKREAAAPLRRRRRKRESKAQEKAAARTRKQAQQISFDQ